MRYRRAAWLGLWLAMQGCGSGLKVRQSVLDRDAVRGMECIAVLPFQNHTASPAAGEMIAQAVASRLLTSERYNTILPTETGQLLALLGAPVQAATSSDVAKRYGELLGVQGVLIGAVTELDRRDLTTRTWTAESVVGFSARLVSTGTGRVVWTGTTSNFDFQSAFAIPASSSTIVQQAVDATVVDLLDARDETVARRGLCAKAYAALQRGERPEAAKLAALVETPGPAGGAVTTHPPSPAEQGATPGSALPALPDAPGGPAGGAEALPALPDLGGGDSFGAVPALPDLQDSAAAPVEGLPPLGAAPPEDDLPPLVSEASDAPAEGTAPSAEGAALTSAATPPQKPSQAVLKSLKPPQKKLMIELYRPRSHLLAAVFPPNPKAKAAVLPKTKRSLDQLAALLSALPELEVRLDVHVDLPAKTVTDAMQQTLAEQRAEVMVAYLRDKLGVSERQLTSRAFGRSQPKVPKRGGKPNTRVEITVLRYPTEEPHDVPAIDSVPNSAPAKGRKKGANNKRGGNRSR